MQPQGASERRADEAPIPASSLQLMTARCLSGEGKVARTVGETDTLVLCHDELSCD